MFILTLYLCPCSNTFATIFINETNIISIKYPHELFEYVSSTVKLKCSEYFVESAFIKINHASIHIHLYLIFFTIFFFFLLISYFFGLSMSHNHVAVWVHFCVYSIIHRMRERTAITKFWIKWRWYITKNLDFEHEILFPSLYHHHCHSLLVVYRSFYTVCTSIYT